MEDTEETLYTCIFNKRNPIPDPDDPYQVVTTTLSESFLEKHREEHPSYQFPTKEDEVIVLGPYWIDPRMCLGRGDDGRCYLGKHLQTGAFVVAKKRYMTVDKEEMHQEVKNLKALGRLYGIWRKTDNHDTSTPNAYLIIPFVDGECLSRYLERQPWIKAECEGDELKFDDVNAGLTLVQSLIDQLNFISQRGVKHDDVSCNVLITSCYKHVVFVDFGYSGDLTPSSVMNFSPLLATEVDGRKYANYTFYLLGLKDFLRGGVGKNLRKPQDILRYLREMPRTNPFTLQQLNDAFKPLKEAYKLNL